MPLTKKGDEILSHMTDAYGAKKGKAVFYASANKGTIHGVHGGKKKHRGNPTLKRFHRGG